MGRQDNALEKKGYIQLSLEVLKERRSVESTGVECNVKWTTGLGLE